MKTQIDIDQFVKSYLATASWCSEYPELEFAKGYGYEHAKKDCLKFIKAVETSFGKERALELLTIPGNDLSYLAPHDFFLTRNGHGAGFWSKPEYYGDEDCNTLTEVAHTFGESDVYKTHGKLAFY